MGGSNNGIETTVSMDGSVYPDQCSKLSPWERKRDMDQVGSLREKTGRWGQCTYMGVSHVVDKDFIVKNFDNKEQGVLTGNSQEHNKDSGT